jgi:hypothetical protein
VGSGPPPRHHRTTLPHVSLPSPYLVLGPCSSFASSSTQPASSTTPFPLHLSSPSRKEAARRKPHSTVCSSPPPSHLRSPRAVPPPPIDAPRPPLPPGERNRPRVAHSDVTVADSPPRWPRSGDDSGHRGPPPSILSAPPFSW